MVSDSIRDLSEKIVAEVVGRMADEVKACALDIASGRPIERREALVGELNTYVQNAITIELGKITGVLSGAETVDEFECTVSESLRTIKIEDMGFSRPPKRALLDSGCVTLGDILERHPVDIVDIQGFGKSGRDYLDKYLRDFGIAWSDSLTVSAIRKRRFERLEKYPVLDLMTCASCGKPDIWEAKVLEVGDLRDYIHSRLTNVSDLEIQSYDLRLVGSLFSNRLVTILRMSGIQTLGALLSVSETDLATRLGVERDSNVIDGVKDGLAKVGRSLAEEVLSE